MYAVDPSTRWQLVSSPLLMPSNVCRRIDSLYAVKCMPSNRFHNRTWECITEACFSDYMTWAYRMRVSLDIDYMTWDFHNRTWAFIKDACLSDVSDWRNVGNACPHVSDWRYVGNSYRRCMPFLCRRVYAAEFLSWDFINAACLSYAVESLPQQDLGIHQYRMPCRRHFLPFERMPSNRFCMPSNVSRRIDSTTGLGHSLHDLRIHQCRMPFGCQRLAQRWQRVSLVYILQFMRDSVFCSVHNVST